MLQIKVTKLRAIKRGAVPCLFIDFFQLDYHTVEVVDASY